MHWQRRIFVCPGRIQHFSRIVRARESYQNPLPTLRFACVRFLLVFLQFLVTNAANRKVGMVEKVFESLSSLELFNFTILSFGAQNVRKNKGNQAAANRKVEMVLGFASLLRRTLPRSYFLCIDTSSPPVCPFGGEGWLGI